MGQIVQIKVGDPIPSIDLYENDPHVKVNIAEICAATKIILLGVPGAFSSACTKGFIPDYIERADELKKKGVNEIICVAVNDTFVMTAWSKCLNVQGRVRMLSDLHGKFTKAIGLETNLVILSGIRSKRYSMVVDHGVITQLNVEPDDSGTGLSCSLASKLKIK